MGLAAGDLDRELILLRATSTTNAFNEAELAFSPLATVWAAKRDISDGERTRAAETGATITTRFTTHWTETTAGLDGRDRVSCEGREYDVVGVKETAGFHIGVEITATARAERP